MNDSNQNNDKYKSTKQYSVIDEDLQFSTDKDSGVCETDNSEFGFGAETKEILKQYDQTEVEQVNTQELNSIFAGQTQDFVHNNDDEISNTTLANALDRISIDDNEETSTSSSVTEDTLPDINLSSGDEEGAANYHETMSAVAENQESFENDEPSQSDNISLDNDIDINNDNLTSEPISTQDNTSNESFTNTEFNDYQDDTKKTQAQDQAFNNQSSQEEMDDEGLMTHYDLELQQLEQSPDNSSNNVDFLKNKIEILQHQVALFRPSHEMIEKVRNTQEYLNLRLKEANTREKYAAFDFLKNVVEPFHWLELTVKNLPNLDLEDIEVLKKTTLNFTKGLEIVLDRFMNVFKDNGVTIISPRQGDKFDERYHDAVDIENTTEYPENHIAKIIKKGFMLHDRLITPASVVVAKP